MCTHVLVAVSLQLNTVYHAGVQDSFVMDVSVLVLRLEAANLNIKQTKGVRRHHVREAWELGRQAYVLERRKRPLEVSERPGLQ